MIIPTGLDGEIIKQGFGYVLFMATWPIIYFLYSERTKESQKVQDLSEKRVEDVKALLQSNASVNESIRSSYTESLDKVSKVVDSTYQIVQNVQQLLNLRESNHA